MKTLKSKRRIYHPWWEWECYRAGFYATTPPDGIDDDTAMLMYAEFLEDYELFRKMMVRVSMEWPKSCEQFLTNPSINRIAWLGQAAMCLYSGVPSKYRTGFRLMSIENQERANANAEEFLRGFLNG